MGMACSAHDDPTRGTTIRWNMVTLLLGILDTYIRQAILFSIDSYASSIVKRYVRYVASPFAFLCRALLKNPPILTIIRWKLFN